MPYLTAAALKDEVLSMEHSLDTVIGSSGTRLSGGQAQRAGPGQNACPPKARSDSGRSVFRAGPQHGGYRFCSLAGLHKR